MSFVTRVSLYFSSEGASPSKVIEKLHELGFHAVRGSYDFAYEHESTSEMNESELSQAILEIANAVHDTLTGFNVLYALATHPKEEATESIPLEDIDAELEATRKELQEIESETKKE
ncbi:MAG: hypothetical protein ACTSUO_03935 [Candidatus Thorarchaeota archaeon]